MEQKEQIPLSLVQKMQLKIHVSMCSGCRNYMKQSELINKLFNKTIQMAPAEDTKALEEKIVSKIS